MLNRLSLLSGLTLAVGVTALVLTNPTLEDYGAYAGEQLTAYLTQEYCAQIPAFLNSLIAECQALLQTLQPELKALFIRQTRRQNFGILSLYRTELSLLNLSPLEISLPTYRFATLAGAGQFYTYKIEQVQEKP